MMRLALACLFLLAAAANAGPIGDLFADGVFGLTWGSTREQVEAKFSGGKWETKFGTRTYVVRDGRAVLGVERTPKNTMEFAFTSDRMSSVGVEFAGGVDQWGLLLQKSEEAFGRRLQGVNDDVAGVVSTEWMPEAGIKVSLVNLVGLMGGRIILNIANTTPVPKTKEELGLQ